MQKKPWNTHLCDNCIVYMTHSYLSYNSFLYLVEYMLGQGRSMMYRDTGFVSKECPLLRKNIMYITAVIPY